MVVVVVVVVVVIMAAAAVAVVVVVVVVVIRDGQEPHILGSCSIRFGFFIDGIGNIFPWWSSVMDYM